MMLNVWTAVMDFTAITASAGIIVLITVGGLLNLMKEMAEPVRVRVKNDFRDKSVH
ncbi:hypothetical protein [Oribacterium sp. C9]|uniref:hypothetical protein n=1 Tax=Oribacterium sp. C9 TaxID=1943579 RepID=UPI00143BDD83|nr:hypothetical protein [Oribacterium sp. C9]